MLWVFRGSESPKSSVRSRTLTGLFFMDLQGDKKMSICRNCLYYRKVNEVLKGDIKRVKHICKKYPEVTVYGDVTDFVIKDDCGCFTAAIKTKKK